MEQETNYQVKRTTRIWPFIFGVVVIAGLGWLAYNAWMAPSEKASGQTTENVDGGTEENGDQLAVTPLVYERDAVNVGICTWPGYATAIWFNNGLTSNALSRFTKEFGLKVNFNIMDDLGNTRNALKSGDMDMVWGTIDAFSAEANGLAVDPSYVSVFGATDCSTGGDAVVVKEGINSIEDLRGKTIVFAELSPSHSYLMSLLKSGGMTMGDINPMGVPTPTNAGEIFRADEADAAVVWSPDDLACVEKVKGSHILTSTKVTSNLIYNVFLVRRAYLAEHHDEAVKFFEGWMTANAELKVGGDEVREQVAEAMVKHMGGAWTSTSDALLAMNNAKFLTIGDNLDLFGFNKNYKGAEASDIYTQFGTMYKESGSIKKTPPDWKSVFDSSIIFEVAENLKGAMHKGQEPKKFTPVTEDIVEKPALTHMSVTVTFATNSAKLDNEAKNTIDREFGDAIKFNRDARIRVVGNTDNTGSVAVNTELSLRRANAVKAYLVSEYNSDPNRFIIVGNGPKAAIADGVDGESEDYRRTDFELVQE